MELQEYAQKIESREVTVVAVLYDSTEALDRFSRKHKITFALMSDSESVAIKALGLLNEEMDPETKYYGVPYPGIFLLDESNRIVAKFAEMKYQDRPLFSDIMEAVTDLTD